MIFRSSVIIGIFTVFSVLLGVVRDRLLADIVGIGSDLDIYNAAFRIPDLTLGLLFAFVSSATIIPFLADAIQKEDKRSVEERMSSMFFFFGASMLLVSIVVVLFLPLFARVVVPGFTGEQLTEYIRFTRILMIQPILLGLSTLLSTFFQAKQQFYIYGIAPLLYTLAIIASIFGYKDFGLTSIIIGVVIGAVLHFGLQLVTLYKEGIHLRYRDFKQSLVREQLTISLPRSGSIVLSQLRALFFASFATTLGVGVLSAFVFAQRLFEVILQVIAQTVSTASIPLLARYVSQGEDKKYTQTVTAVVAKVVAMSAVAALLVFALKDIVVSILFGAGHTDIVAFVPVFMASVPFAAFNAYMTSAMAASKDTKTQLYSNIVSTIVAIAATILLKNTFGMMSIVYGFLIGSVMQTVCIAMFLYIKKNIYAY